MDRSTIGTWGAIVVVVIVIAVMIAFATPFGKHITGGVNNVVNGMEGVADDLLQQAGGGGVTGGNNDNSSHVDAATGEILDSWEEIIAAVNNGSYKTRYAVGNYKELNLGTEGAVNMEIVAIDADVRSDGSGRAHITWIAQKLLKTKYQMNDTATLTGGWGASALRAYLEDSILPLFDPALRNAILAVDKTYYSFGTSETLVASDRLWIPSWREVVMGVDREDSGVIYSQAFETANDRIKYLNSTATAWWLRSTTTSGTTSFAGISTTGTNSSSSATSKRGILIGFCL